MTTSSSSKATAISATSWPVETGAGDGTVGPGRVCARQRVYRGFWHWAVRLLMVLHRIALVLAGLSPLRLRRRIGQERLNVLLTGTFYSENWATAHLRPLAASSACASLCVVSTFPVSSMPNLEIVYPPKWLVRVAGAVPARLSVFAWLAISRRPHVVGGFHLLVNGLVSAVLARLIGARSIYFCVGGPMELLDGGIWAENRLFGRIGTPDPVVERQLIKAVGAFDLVITMGTRAVQFFRRNGVTSRFHVVSGGIDSDEYRPGDAQRSVDLILVGRLAKIKRVDVFLSALTLVAKKIPEVSAVIIGDGELRAQLEELTRELGICRRVLFAGHQCKVADWLKRSRIFVLTSDSEGLALSMMEAMMCGLPAVVSNVGDLADLVEDSVNGYLVDDRCPEAFASRIVDLLEDDQKLARFSQAARHAALRHDAADVARKWDAILEDEEMRRNQEEPNAVINRLASSRRQHLVSDKLGRS